MKVLSSKLFEINPIATWDLAPNSKLLILQFAWDSNARFTRAICKILEDFISNDGRQFRKNRIISIKIIELEFIDEKIKHEINP